MTEELRVKKIKDGTVIDHIKAGKGKKVLDILGVDNDFTNVIILIMNVPSSRLGSKDIVKIENKALEREEVNKIALIAPNATWNVIKDFEVTNKNRIELPSILEGVLKCPNPKCITNMGEPVKSKFKVEEKEPAKLRCAYCERLFSLEDVL